MDTPRLHALPAGLLTLADHEAHAKTLLPASVWAYFSGGAADEITLRANQTAWSHWALRPRVLRPLAGLSLHTELLGRRWPTPLLVAPMAQQRLAHPDGECAMALAAAALGVGMVLSTQTHTPLHTVAPLVLEQPERGPLWFQLYHHGDRGWTRDLLQQAQEAGYEAIVLTVDAPIQGVRDRERRHPIPPQAGLDCPHLPPGERQAHTPAQLLAQAATWDDVHWLRDHSPLPLLLKGITHPDDAALARQLGADGVIVSNHGGRVLDTVPATAALLPAIVEQLQGQGAVLVDGGIRRGTDMAKALALGANAVLIGRPALWGLANAGAAGVAHVLRLLLDELWATLGLCGVTHTHQLGREHLHPAP